MSSFPRILSAGLMVLVVFLLLACHASREAENSADAGTLGLPPVPTPNDNLPTSAKVNLGRKLFMDRRLSHNNTMSCAMCHVPEQGFTANELSTGLGMEGRSLRRNAPTVLNVAFVRQLFHDGREFSLEQQAWGPLLTSNEMGNPSIGYVIEKIRLMPDYKNLFEVAFDGKGPSMQNIGAAIASYERSLVAANSRFDRWRYGHQSEALNDAEQAGFKIFTGKARCVSCHSIGDEFALFSDGGFHNTGIGWARTMGQGNIIHKIQLAPGVIVEVADSALMSTSEPLQADIGRYEITHDENDRWAYRTPSLRNIALTAPYMHDGSLATLEEVLAFYLRGGIDNSNKDVLLTPLSLTVQEQSELLAFLRSLTGSNVTALSKQARAEPIDHKIPEIDPATQYAGACKYQVKHQKQTVDCGRP